MHDTDRTTKALLMAGVVAGPLFIAVALLQAWTRDGFDIVSHPASLLSLGGLGWIQITNFVVAGALFTACAVGVRQRLRGKPGRVWAPILVGIFGIASVAGGVFVMDEGLGFPPGAPEGFADSMSWHATVHAFAPMIAFVAINISFFVFARYFAFTKDKMWMIASIVAGSIVLILFASFNMTLDVEGVSFNFLPLWAAIFAGFSWASITMAKLRSTMQ